MKNLRKYLTKSTRVLYGLCCCLVFSSFLAWPFSIYSKDKIVTVETNDAGSLVASLQRGGAAIWPASAIPFERDEYREKIQICIEFYLNYHRMLGDTVDFLGLVKFAGQRPLLLCVASAKPSPTFAMAICQWEDKELVDFRPEEFEVDCANKHEDDTSNPLST